MIKTYLVVGDMLCDCSLYRQADLGGRRSALGSFGCENDESCMVGEGRDKYVSFETENRRRERRKGVKSTPVLAWSGISPGHLYYFVYFHGLANLGNPRCVLRLLGVSLDGQGRPHSAIPRSFAERNKQCRYLARHNATRKGRGFDVRPLGRE
jgi:hypothetical protein